MDPTTISSLAGDVRTATVHMTVARFKRAGRTRLIVMKVDAHEGWADLGHALWAVETPDGSTSEAIGSARARIEAGRVCQRRRL